jgi:hypothetical protein
VSVELASLLAFLEEQRARQAPHFPGFAAGQILCFMGTTSLSGSSAACSVNAIRKIERGPSERDMRIVLAGPIARLPGPGECISVHLTRVDRYQGYQVKTRALARGALPSDVVEEGAQGLVVKGAQIYTVHHSPYTLRFFENVPFEEVEELVSGLRYALVAVGETANLSPRFIFHYEVKDERLALYHGDGLALKTYMNLRANRSETRLILDLDDLTGWVLHGTVDEFAPHQYPEAYERICRGFTAGNWGKPSRVFRFVPETFERIRPVG